MNGGYTFFTKIINDEIVRREIWKGVHLFLFLYGFHRLLDLCSFVSSYIWRLLAVNSIALTTC